MTIKELKRQYLKTTGENPDLEYFLSTREICVHILKAHPTESLRVEHQGKAMRHPPLPYHLIDPTRSLGETTSTWGRSTTKGRSTPSSQRTQTELASWWKARRKEIREQHNIPADPKVDEALSPQKEEKKSGIKAQYAEVLQNHPDILTYLSSKEILQGLLQRDITAKDVQKIRYLGFRRHPMTPKTLVNMEIQKKYLMRIWELDDLPGKSGKKSDPESLALEKIRAREWRATREDHADELGITLKKAEIPAALAGTNLETMGLKEMAQLIGCSLERARQIRTKFDLPSNKPQKTLHMEWILAHAHEIPNYSMEKLEEILQTNRTNIRSLLRKTGVVSRKHPVFGANLRIGNIDLCKIYQADPGLVWKARKNAGIQEETDHPDYAQRLIEETERAETTLKLWALTSTIKPLRSVPDNTDWSKPLHLLQEETGWCINKIRRERYIRGIESDPSKWKIGHRENTVQAKVSQLLQTRPEFTTRPTKEIAKAIGHKGRTPYIQTILHKHLSTKEMPEATDLLKPTLDILAKSPQNEKSLRNQLALQTKLSRHLLLKTNPGSKITLFETLTLHARTILIQGGFLYQEGNTFHLTPRGKTLQESWNDQNPPKILELKGSNHILITHPTGEWEWVEPLSTK